ncbi:MAG: CZB domain-containing protein [Solirubrobacteraceae bacterium]
MADTAKQLTHGIAAHGAWKNRLRKAIETGHSEYSVETLSRDDQCDLGNWFYNGMDATERTSEHFNTAMATHREFHRVAGGVLADALAGHKDQASSSMAIGGEFSKVSAAITMELMNWLKSL